MSVSLGITVCRSLAVYGYMAHNCEPYAHHGVHQYHSEIQYHIAITIIISHSFSVYVSSPSCFFTYP
jgi:hypothetical protein